MAEQSCNHSGNLGDLLSRASEPSRRVLVDLRLPDAPQSFTAKELANQVRAFARGLQRAGVQPGDAVGFLTANRWELLAGYLGAMWMGAVAVPINYKFPRSTIEHIVQDSAVRLLFFDHERAGLVPGGVQAMSLDEGFDAFPDPGDLDVFVPKREHTAEILYTSGSTGLPKGVPLSHFGQLWAASQWLEPVADGPGGSSLIVAPLYHMNGLFFSTVCLLNGMQIVLMPAFEAASYIRAAAEYRCSYLSGVPTMFALVAALDESLLPDDLSFVERVMVGSAPLSDSLLRTMKSLFPAAVVSNGYGSTEAGPAIFGAHPEGLERPPMSIGYPMSSIEWRLVGGESDNEGVLETRTPATTSGYLNRPDAVAERFRDGWFNSNDIMRRDENGFFYFVSRADDMFVCGGENIYPGEVEKLLNQHTSVQQSLVVGAPDDIKGMVPVAFVVPAPGTKPDEQAIRDFALQNGPAYAHPRRVVFKDVLPVGGTHKINRTALEAEARALMIAAGRATPPEETAE